MNSRIAVARHCGFGTVVVDAALTGVDAGFVTGPEIPGHSVLVVPPAIGDASKLEWCVIANVL